MEALLRLHKMKMYELPFVLTELYPKAKLEYGQKKSKACALLFILFISYQPPAISYYLHMTHD
jgi:hypothetical protein